MTDSIILRPAKPQESPALSALAFRSKSYWGYSQDFMEACRTELSVSEEDISNSRRHYVLAESNGKIVGYYALEQLCGDEDDGTGYELEALFVEPQHVRQGIGRKLIEHAKTYAQKEGAEFLLIQGDPNATKFYLAAGGVQIGDRESDSIPGRYLPKFKISLGAEGAG